MFHGVLWDYVVVDTQKPATVCEGVRLKYGYSSQKRNSQTNAKSFPSGIYPSITLILMIKFLYHYTDQVDLRC